MKGKHYKTLFTLAILMLLMVPQRAWATTAYVSTYAELRDAISDASIDVIIVTANIDVPCGNSGNAGNTDLTGASTAQLIINRSLTLQSQAGSKYIIKRVAANGATSSALKSMIAIRGNGQGNSGTDNLSENTVEVSFTNIIIDGGANWGSTSVSDRYNAAADECGCSGRATIDIYLGATLNLEDGVEIRNGFTTKSDNSLLNDASTSQCFGGAVRVDYHNATGGGTINIKAGATIHDCTARGGYGGALGAYNYARLNLYGGTIYNCSAKHGGAIACTYRSASGYGDATAGTIRMYGGTISNCCAENGGALCTHGPVEDYVLGGTITSCSATYGGAIYQAFSTTVIHIVDHNSGKLTISNCTNTHETPTENTDGYHFVYLSSGSINVTPVYQVTFRDNNTDFAVLSVAQGTSLGEAFPAAPAKAGIRFLGWYNGNTQVTSSTVINDNITVTAKWEFFGSGTSANPYQIPSAEAWNFLADNVNNGNTYSGKYFQQTGDFTVSSKIIGYPTDDTHYVTFNGIYDGNGCTITASINKSGERYVAPFHCIADASIKNVVVTGSVTVSGGASIERRRHPAGLVGVTDGTCILQNCRVSANVSGCDYMGGLIGHTQNANITITGCVYSGILTASDSNNTGGLIGWGGDNGGKTYTLTNNLFAGSYSGSGKFHPVGFLYNPTGNTRTVTNTYYMAGLQKISDDDGNSLVKGLENKGKFAYSITSGTNVIITDLGSATATYNVSGITAYDYGLKCGGTYYAGNGESVSLNLSHTPYSGYNYEYSATSGTLTGESNPYSLEMPDANVTINARYSASKDINKYTPNGHDGWYLISSPIGTVNPANVLNMTREDIHTYDIFRFNQNPAQNNAGNYLELENWNEPNSESINHNHFDLVPGRGYLYANSANVTLTFIGTPYSGDGVVNLEYSTANPDSRMHGWNLIGNPFGVVSTVDKASLKMNADRDGFEAQTEGASVAAMEGVFVQATATGQSATFTVPTRGSEKAVVARTNIMVSGDKGKVLDNAIIRFDDGEALGKFQLRESSTKVYIPVDGKDYAIANADDQGEIPVNFKAEKNGSYTLSFSNENIDFGYLHLIDNKTGANVDLLAQPSYTFTAKTTDYESRFRLVFSVNGPSTGSGTDEPFAFYANGEWIVLNEGEATLQVIDIIGRQLLSEKAYSEFRIPNSAFSTSGVYILRLINGDSVRTQKIVVR